MILDEIHALVGNKRGADLAVSLERLETHQPVQRIGLSATCAPLAKVAEFLVGVGRPCTVAPVIDTIEKQFTVEPLLESLEYSPGWLATLLDRLDSELAACRTTLIFTNTRNLAERLTWASAAVIPSATTRSACITRHCRPHAGVSSNGV